MSIVFIIMAFVIRVEIIHGKAKSLNNYIIKVPTLRRYLNFSSRFYEKKLLFRHFQYTSLLAITVLGQV